MLTRIGKYEIEETLGQGSFGTVFRARDPGMGGNVAIKVLNPGLSPELRARFPIEAGTTRKLRHKNIVTIYDFDEDNGMPFLVMELLEGETLEKAIDDHRSLSLLDKVRIMFQVAEGLLYAHRCRVIHRDIKPGNIMLLPDGNIKIMDFGIARITGTEATRLTRTGDFAGTYAYVAPAQWHGAPGDELADIFAYGVVYYELLTGTNPFRAQSIAHIMARICSVDPDPLHEVIPDCPEALELIVNKCLAKESELRYQSLDDILLDTEPVLQYLKRQRAEAIMQEVKSLAGAEPDELRPKLREALELDGYNKDARKLWKQLVEEDERKKVKIKVDALKQDADASLAKRDYNKAIEILETAVKFHRFDNTAHSLLEKAKAGLAASRQAATFLSEARRQSQLGDLDAAYKAVEAAVQADPGHPDAQERMTQIADQIKNRDRQRSGELLRRAEVLRQAGKYPSALQVLDEAAGLGPPNPALEVLRDRVRAEANRRQDIEDRLGELRQLIELENLDQARVLVEALEQNYPESSELTDLRFEVLEKLAARRRVEAIATATASARTLLAKECFKEAEALLRTTQANYPGDPIIQQLLKDAIAFRAADTRASEIAKAADRATTLWKSGDRERALAGLAADIQQFGPEPALVNLRTEIRNDLEQRYYAGGLQRTLDESRQHLAAGRTEEAVAVLEIAGAQYKNEAAIASLLAEARAADGARKERDFSTAVIKRVNELIPVIEPETLILRDTAKMHLRLTAEAADHVRQALRRYPSNSELQRTLDWLEHRIQEGESAERLLSYRDSIQEAVRRQHWDEAESLLEKAGLEWPPKALKDITAQVQSGRFLADLDTWAVQVRRSLNAGDLDAADRQITAGGTKFSSEEIWRDLRAETDRFLILRRARELGARGEHRMAEGVLEEFLRQHKSDEAAVTLLGKIRAERERLESQAALGRALAEIEELVRTRQFKAASEHLGRIAREFPSNPALERYKRLIRDAEGLEAERASAARREMERLEEERRQRVQEEMTRREAARSESEQLEKARKARSEAERREKLERERQARSEQERAATERIARDAREREQDRVREAGRRDERLKQEREEAVRQQTEFRTRVLDPPEVVPVLRELPLYRRKYFLIVVGIVLGATPIGFLLLSKPRLKPEPTPPSLEFEARIGGPLPAAKQVTWSNGLVAFEVTGKPRWVSVSPSSGDKLEDFTVSVAEMPSGTRDDKMEITIRDSGGQIDKILFPVRLKLTERVDLFANPPKVRIEWTSNTKRYPDTKDIKVSRTDNKEVNLKATTRPEDRWLNASVVAPDTVRVTINPTLGTVASAKPYEGTITIQDTLLPGSETKVAVEFTILPAPLFNN